MTSRQRKGAEAVIDDMIDEHMESAPSDERIKQLEVAAVEAQRKLEQAAACANGMPEPLRQNKMAQCEEEMNRLGAALNQLEHQSDSTQGNLASVPGYVESGFTSLDWAVRERIEQCPTCSSQVGLDHLVNCHTFFSNTIDAVESANSTAREQLNTFTQERVSLERQYADAERQLLNITNTPSRTDAGITLEDARESLNRVSLALNNTMMLKSKWDQVIAAKQLIHNLNDEVDSYKEIKKSCDKAMSEILSLQSDRFVSVVQSHLPEDWVFQIKLNDKDTGRRTFSMGLVRGGELHEALSGAEWASVTTAVAMAVSEINIPKDKPAVLIPEDRAWDGKTLSSVMRSFRNFNGQVIMASTIRPTGRAPAGWTIIDMDKTSASWLVSEDPLSEDKEEVVVEVGPVEVTEAPQEEVRKDDTIRRPKNTATVTTASAIAIGMMGFSEEDISVMSKNTAADIIRKSLKPGDIEILSGGGYALINGGKVLNLPPAPSR